MSLPAWWGSSLPCGCVRGVKLCDEAVRLWDDVADAHNVLAKSWTLHNGVDTAIARGHYDEALSRFTAHIEIEAEPAVQGMML
jgi:hypothetical protein